MKKVIGFRNDEATYAQRMSWNKMTILNNLIEAFLEATNEASIIDLKIFEADSMEYAYKVIKEKHPEGIALKLSNEGLAKLYGYDLSTLNDIQEKYRTFEGKINYNPKKNIFEIPSDQSEFNIVAETAEELEKLQDCEDLCKVLNKLISYDDAGTHLNGLNIYKWICTNESGTNLIPDHRFIKL